MSSRNPSGLHLLPRFWAGVAVLAVTMTGVAGCSSSSPRKAAAPGTPPATSTTTTTASAPAVNPLTGVGAPPSGPVIAVKVDDTANGRPSRGIDQAGDAVDGARDDGLVGVEWREQPRKRPCEQRLPGPGWPDEQ